jgi:hypothetical protein
MRKAQGRLHTKTIAATLRQSGEALWSMAQADACAK